VAHERERLKEKIDGLDIVEYIRTSIEILLNLNENEGGD
jgi:hypothetical protein